jgi:hypothetical protein
LEKKKVPTHHPTTKGSLTPKKKVGVEQQKVAQVILDSA